MPLQDATKQTINSPKKDTGKRTFSLFGRKKSKDIAVTAQAVAPDVQLSAARSPTFFSVVHTFNEGKADQWWQFISSMSPSDWAAMTDKHHALGFHNHSFLPTGPTGVINCLWECKSDVTVEEFQAFIDGPDGPGEGVFVNKSFKVMPGAFLPSSYFYEPQPKPQMPSTGSMFWVYHEFQEGAGPSFWESMAGMTPEQMGAMASKNASLGFWNHSFQPLAPEGPVICVWESQREMSSDEFQQFIDGPDGPGGGQVFLNQVHKAIPGAVLPPAKFPKPSVTHHRYNTIPIVPGSMAQLVGKAESEAFRAELAAIDGLIRVEVLAIDEATIVSHSRWESEAYGASAAAALGKVLAGALKEFVAGPPVPTVGTIAWQLSGGAHIVEGADAVVRLTTMSFKQGTFDKAWSIARANEGRFQTIDGLVSIEMVKTGEESCIVAAKYHSHEALEAATPLITEIMRSMAACFAAPPTPRVGRVAFTHPEPAPLLVCKPVDESPDKVLGPDGQQAKLWVSKMPDGRQASRIVIDAGFDWRATVKPMLPGCPDWCPATHFGYLESGRMGIRMKDGTERWVNAGETYFVPPGHLPLVNERTVMIEFSQDTTYTKDIQK